MDDRSVGDRRRRIGPADGHPTARQGIPSGFRCEVSGGRVLRVSPPITRRTPGEEAVSKHEAGVAPLALVVDEDAATRMRAHFELRAAGLRVEEAAGGEAAIAAVAEHRPDLVLLD